ALKDRRKDMTAKESQWHDVLRLVSVGLLVLGVLAVTTPAAHAEAKTGGNGVAPETAWCTLSVDIPQATAAQIDHGDTLGPPGAGAGAANGREGERAEGRAWVLLAQGKLPELPEQAACVAEAVELVRMICADRCATIQNNQHQCVGECIQSQLPDQLCL